ncbi:SufE family protein [Rhodospirillaceae bacterium]|nr:Fe-S cluster assembly protein SufE [Rhodospirillaceae bacterium]MDC0998692.1 SufE family protein [Alphaproteobacteria bacterium]MBP03032.1 Fe-S cluster assembly protein SufE [Rhodospirillaceae bacterium]MBT5913908.1 SufE family protein [Rhodospirillaceae bacterium]MBT6304697.1 SufE family protein [Rhodospirillaceae bacterium]|tara:strand:- start:15 stop:467 length:453 start_codon:yes stop_codon:yes gene_type:complete
MGEYERSIPETTISEEQANIIEEFSFFEDWMDRYQYLIDIGRKLPLMPEEYLRDEFKLKGCQSQVWFVGEAVGERLIFRASSDAAIVAGLIAILLRIYSNRTPEEILSASPSFVKDLGLEEHLSPTRKNGLGAMLKSIMQRAELGFNQTA